MKSLAVLLVLAGAALAAPIATYFAVASYAAHRQASIRHFDLVRQQRELKEYGEELAEYKDFAGRVERFVDNARAAGISEESWNRHRVDIHEQAATFAELHQFIADARGGENYYFLPAKLRIMSGEAGRQRNSFGRRTVATAPGEVRVSLAGEFLVPVQ